MQKKINIRLLLPLVLIVLALLAAWWLRPRPPQPVMEPREGFSDLEPAPDWGELEIYQQTITREEFERLLVEVYSEGAAWKPSIELFDERAEIRTTDDTPFTLRFADQDSGSVPGRYWRAASKLPPATDLENRPLAGVRIAIDPGHIGGQWARMEERWYQIGGRGIEVKEGELTLRVAQLLRPLLKKLGAEVELVRDRLAPVTKLRPDDFEPMARGILEARGFDPDNPPDDHRMTVEWQSEKLFYRSWEIRERAWHINERIQPDLVLCLHFNAEAWDDPASPTFVPRNHFHLLINGTYSLGEFASHDQRFHLVKRLLQRIHREELDIGKDVADAMVEATGLPAYVYPRSNAKLVSDNPYIFARNLLANRVYHCPIVFLEPYVMNNQEVYERLEAGDYEGERTVAGKSRKSIFREYADGVAEGLARHFRRKRG